MRPVTAGLCVFLASCATTAAGIHGAQRASLDPYAITFDVIGCTVQNAEMVSQQEIPTYTYHTLVLFAGNVTSGTYGINCPPVLAGGKTKCLITDMNFSLPSETAGLMCAKWDRWTIRRQ
jgi:hypothetical protein